MRCFLAIELPEGVRRRLGELQRQLAGLDRVLRWTKVEQLHLTLKFFGEIPGSDVARLSTIVKATAVRLAPFDIQIAGTGLFPAGGPPRVVWAGLAEPHNELLITQQWFQQAFAEIGYPPEARAYSPHLTLARTRDRADARRIRTLPDELPSFTAGSFRVSEVVLFESILGAGGARHVPLMRAALSAGSP